MVGRLRVGALNMQVDGAGEPGGGKYNPIQGRF